MSTNWPSRLWDHPAPNAHEPALPFPRSCGPCTVSLVIGFQLQEKMALQCTVRLSAILHQGSDTPNTVPDCHTSSVVTVSGLFSILGMCQALR
jgi:hypothetical protein